LPARELPVPPAVTGPAPGEQTTVRAAAGMPAPVSVQGPAQAADPVRVRVPAIGVDAGIVALEVDAQGVLPPPATNHEAGWWRAGPEPGEQGPAVIVGHVDSRQGPAVFFRLRQLGPGDQILVDRADGSTTVFVVDRSERFGKDAFPTHAVYGPTPDAQLRLITCGGRFDRSTRHYVDNVVVFARAA
jgi:sortase (surface protein transpeptidase)